MVHQLADKYLKELVKHHLEEFIALIHSGGKYEIVSTPLNKELIVRRREGDFVAKVRVGRRIYLFHFEFLSQYRRRNVREAYGYGGALTLNISATLRRYYSCSNRRHESRKSWELTRLRRSTIRCLCAKIFQHKVSHELF